MCDTLSSGTMEPSNGWKDTVALGRLLVDQLGEEGEDIAITWMAHHVARLIREAEAASPEHLVAAQDRCRKAVLDLWQCRRAVFERAPLSGIDDLSEALVALRTGRNWFFDRMAGCQDEPEPQAIRFAQIVDEGARAIIRALISDANRDEAIRENEWLRLSREHRTSVDRIIFMMDEAKQVVGHDEMTEEHNASREALLRQLEQFGALAHEISAALKAEKS